MAYLLSEDALMMAFISEFGGRDNRIDIFLKNEIDV
jgi:hypothetical protein